MSEKKKEPVLPPGAILLEDKRKIGDLASPKGLDFSKLKPVGYVRDERETEEMSETSLDYPRLAQAINTIVQGTLKGMGSESSPSFDVKDAILSYREREGIFIIKNIEVNFRQQVLTLAPHPQRPQTFSVSPYNMSTRFYALYDLASKVIPELLQERRVQGKVLEKKYFPHGQLGIKGQKSQNSAPLLLDDLVGETWEVSNPFGIDYQCSLAVISLNEEKARRQAEIIIAQLQTLSRSTSLPLIERVDCYYETLLSPQKRGHLVLYKR